MTDEWFEVQGKDFRCGSNRHHLYICSPEDAFDHPTGAIVFRGYGGHEFHIVPPNKLT
jgi:hypothetical protein